MLVGFCSVERGSLPFAVACSLNNFEMVKMCPRFWRCNSLTNLLFPRHITTQEGRSRLFGDWMLLSIPCLPSICTMCASRTGPNTVPPGIAAKALDLSSALLGTRTKEFTSCGYTLFRICSFLFGADLSEFASFLFGLRPNSSHCDCSVDTELIRWVNNST